MMGSGYEQQTTNKELLKTVTKFIISLTVLTFFFSNPSWLSLFLHSFVSHISGFPSQLLSHINDKNCIFLLFNGILVILAKSSSTLLNDDCNSLQPTELFSGTNDLSQPSEEEDIKLVGIEREVENEEDTFNGEEKVSLEIEDGEVSLEVEDGDEDEYCFEETKDEASIARMSTEELNRKFEEFIRKMKEDIRIEAQQQQQLVMV